MSTVEQICNALGRKKLGERLGVSRAAIANAVADGKFPPRWYRVVSVMCEERGIDCPADIFNFLEPQTSEDAA